MAMRFLCTFSGRLGSSNVCPRGPVFAGQFRSLKTQSTGERFKPSFDPYSYTKGSWLHRDSDKRKARQMRFDFDALLDVAIKSSDGASRVVSCEKQEGNFNRAFVISLDNGAKVVARLPTSLAGPSRLTVASEVATLQYVREKTNVPVPKVLAWNVEAESNAVGAEYIVMEVAPGVLLENIWNEMNGVWRMQCNESLQRIAKELYSLEFADFGSLYFNTSERPAGAISLDEKYCIGPNCARQHWGIDHEEIVHSSTLEGHQGPWHDLAAYHTDCIEIARSSIRQQDQSESVDKHLRLLEIYQSTLAAIKNVEAIKVASKPVLFHPDFHARNIFVDPDDPTRITSVIDWQATAIEPAFVYNGEIPSFKVYLGPEVDEGISVLHPVVRKYMAGPCSGLLIDVLSMHALLTNLSRAWRSLELPGRSLYQSSQPDKRNLTVKSEERASSWALRMQLIELLDCDPDGLVSAERWEEVLPIYREQYEQFEFACVGVACWMEGKSKAEGIEKAQRLWPFDLR